MANRHDVIIWDAELYGTPKSFEEAVEKSKVLVEKKSKEIQISKNLKKL